MIAWVGSELTGCFGAVGVCVGVLWSVGGSGPKTA